MDILRISNARCGGSSETPTSLYQVHNVTSQMTVLLNLISALSDPSLNYLCNSLIDIEYVSSLMKFHKSKLIYCRILNFFSE